MRDLLTGLAIVLIVVLTAALAVPYFVDWNGQRGFLEARLSRALGQRVTIGGAIDLRLLPTPYLSLRQTVIGEDDGPITLAIHTLNLELAVAPLLHGEFDIVEARLGEPTLRVALGHDRTLPALPAAPAFQADVAFERIDVSDGTLAVADPLSDRTYVFERIDMSAEAPALAGPYKATGTSGAADARTAFRFSTAAMGAGRTKLRFNAGETTRHPGLDLEGTLALKDTGHGSFEESFEGGLVLAARASLGGAKTVPWRLSGPLKAGPTGVALTGGELRLGTEDAGLTLQAKVRGDLGGAPRLAVALAAKQLDIDRLSGAPVDARRPPPPKPPSLAGLRDALARTMPPIPTTVDIEVDAATWGGDTLGALAARWSGDGKGRQDLKAAGDGPGGSHLALDGTLPPAGGFTGSLDLASGNLPITLDWLARVDPAFAHAPLDLPFRSASIAGRVTAGDAGLEVDALVLRLGGSTLTGTGHLVSGDASRPTKLALNLHARALDLGALPSLATLRDAAAPYDVDLGLDADKVALGGDAPLDAGPIDLKLTKSGRTLVIDSLKAGNLGGATIEARGRVDAKGATMTAAVDATRLDDAAALVRRLLPGAAADALAARAPALVPAKLTIELGMAAGADGALAPRHLTVAGSAGGTAVTARLAPTAGADEAGTDEAGETIALDATLDARDGGTLLRQLGAPILPLGEIGKGEVVIHARGPSGRPLDTTVHAAFGATALDVAGRFDPLAGSIVGEGRGSAHLTSPDVGPLLRGWAVAFPEVTGRVPVELRADLAFERAGVTVTALTGRVAEIGAKGDLHWKKGAADAPALTGALSLDRSALSTLLALALGPSRPAAGGASYSSERFAGGLVDPPRAKLALRVARLDLTDGLAASDASLDLGVAPGVVTLGHVSATLAGGRTTGDVTLRRSGTDAALEGKVALERVDLTLPGASAVVSGTLDVAGSGSSPVALVASLAGEGTARATGLSISQADPAALPKVFADVEADTLPVDGESVLRALRDGSKGPLSLGDRRFDLSLAGGVLHVAPRAAAGSRGEAAGALQGGAVAAALDATLDLRASRLDEHVRETLLALPPNWTGPAPAIVFTLSGSIGAPRRSIDVSGLIDAVATRALARESARIQTYETDIRERAFFAHRLQSEDRREQDRLKVEDDARRAEADRKAKLEAARQDRLRREEAARAAAARSEQGITQAIQTRAATAKAAREKAIQDRADQDKGIGDGAERTPETGRPDAGPQAAPGDATPDR